VGRNAYDEEEVAMALLATLKGPYGKLLAQRYKLADVDALPGLDDQDLLSRIGKARGAVMSGGRINLQKAADIVLNDFRSGTLGRITLETPDEYSAWLAAAEAEEARKAAEQAALKAAKHSSRQARRVDPDEVAVVEEDVDEDEAVDGEDEAPDAVNRPTAAAPDDDDDRED
jgi:ribosome biogenesis GTPase A